ncbi:FecR family protein [Winogradskyella sp. UBA3174]|uniref:FecR family protein n=1 Tax=Winogradskyella sp. UBA3174 TaxID=1947785 RepID=UPI0025CBC917|nr:FecR domain-containing protein [Winogradskyella sp. UBA3174]|tara:strand:- start:27350 stop:28246 length:897 start_codon:yes stop_codon:yes gene_type:complete
MEREELIKKWLNHNLSAEEQKAFEQLTGYDDLIKMNSALNGFKAPNFFIDESYEVLTPKLQATNKNAASWFKPLLRIAAILAISLSTYYYTTTLETEINTTIAQQTNITLPDASTVDLNANSTLAFNKSKWEESRIVRLNGEAFFKVAKGQKFDVITDNGIVSVLGTEFNVKQRTGYFMVTCYKGLVAVTQNNKTVKLKPGHTFRIIDGKLLADEKENTTQPNWLRGESSFKSMPLKYVISEFENQYNQKITLENIDTSRLFTGSFIHKNIDLALKSITIPLNLSYSKSKTSILLKRE